MSIFYIKDRMNIIWVSTSKSAQTRCNETPVPMCCTKYPKRQTDAVHLFSPPCKPTLNARSSLERSYKSKLIMR